MKRIPRTIVAYLLSLVLMAVVVAWKYTVLPPQIPLLYSLPNSDNQVVDTWIIAVIPLMSFIFININNYIAKRKFAHDVFIRHVVYIADMTIIVACTYIFIKILLLVS